jgi:hypothetical protein
VGWEGVHGAPSGTMNPMRIVLATYPMCIVLATFVAAAVFALPTSALAHGEGGRATGFTSTVEEVRPETPGLELRILDADDRLFLRNETGQDVIVLGYDDEPYLRFSDGAVYRNIRSPAVYLNADRYALGQVPASADPDASPVWRRVKAGTAHEWHDHRIQWMSTIAPDQVRADPESPRHVFDWEVPLTVGGRPTTIAGSLDYVPTDDGPTPLVYVAASLPLVAALLGWALFRHRFKPAAAS